MAIAGSARTLMVGTGNVSVVPTDKQLYFVSAQAFKRGTTIVVDYAGPAPAYFTIDGGAGTTWMVQQLPSITLTNKPFKCTQISNSRARGTDGVFIPGAAHYMYRSPVDASGNPDWYFYFDTVVPEKGLHPYTKDQYTGNMTPASEKEQMLIPDLITRVRFLEGILRAGSTPGTIAVPDKRLRNIEARLNALDSGGAINPTLEQLYGYGD